MFYVYVIESKGRRFAAYGTGGPFSVGIATDPAISLKRVNGEIRGGASFFVSLGPWKPRALYGPYESQEEAGRAVVQIKKLRRAERAKWKEGGDQHPWVLNPLLRPHQF